MKLLLSIIICFKSLLLIFPFLNLDNAIFGLIVKRTLYNQADALNMLLFGTTVAKNSIIPIDSVQANRYIGDTDPIPKNYRDNIFKLPDEEMIERIRSLNIHNAKTVVSAFHHFANQSMTPQETVYNLEKCIHDKKDPLLYIAEAFREAFGKDNGLVVVGGHDREGICKRWILYIRLNYIDSTR